MVTLLVVYAALLLLWALTPRFLARRRVADEADPEAMEPARAAAPALEAAVLEPFSFERTRLPG